MASRKTKIISFRVPYPDYAQMLLVCDKEDLEISEFAKEKFYLDKEKELEQIANLSHQREQHLEKIKNLEALVQEKGNVLASAEKKITSISKDLEGKEIQIKSLQESKKTDADLIKSYKSAAKTALKELDKLKGLVLKNDVKNKELRKNISDLETRLNSANDYCKEHLVGAGMFDSNFKKF